MASCSKSRDIILIKDGAVPGLIHNAESPSTWLKRVLLKGQFTLKNSEQQGCISSVTRLLQKTYTQGQQSEGCRHWGGSEVGLKDVWTTTQTRTPPLKKHFDTGTLCKYLLQQLYPHCCSSLSVKSYLVTLSCRTGKIPEKTGQKLTLFAPHSYCYCYLFKIFTTPCNQE